MMYLHCARCRLAIRVRADYLILTNCPRCLARAGLASRMFSSPLNATELHQHTAVRARHHREIDLMGPQLVERASPASRHVAAMHADQPDAVRQEPSAER